MSPLYKTIEGEYSYGDRTATVYKFNLGVRIIGFKNGDHFDIRFLSIGGNLSRNGLGQCALKILRSRFKRVTVNEIYEAALPFWQKMKERGLVDELGSIKEEKNFGQYEPFLNLQ